MCGSVSAAVADRPSDAWLSSIHLERYRENFVQHGFYSSKDSARFDSQILLHIGITATGHRKRILKLAQKSGAPVGDQAPGALAADTRPEPDRTGAAGEGRVRPVVSGNDSPAEAEGEAEPPPVRPVPKPRTLLNKQHPAPKPVSERLPEYPEASQGFLASGGADWPEPSAAGDPSPLGERIPPTGSEDPSGVPPIPPRLSRGRAGGEGNMRGGECEQPGPGSRSLPALSSFSTLTASAHERPPLLAPSFHSLPLMPSHGSAFMGEMVANELYTTAKVSSSSSERRQSLCTDTFETTKTRPVPQPPTLTRPDTGPHQQSPEGEGERVSLPPPQQPWVEDSIAMGYATVGEAQTDHVDARPPQPQRCCVEEDIDEDLTISPYASFHAVPELANVKHDWLEKLSPQGNYVFQRRYIKFDGKCLMYFNSEKDPYPKGVIPLSVIQMARTARENKFEVVTSHRIFTFRADSETQRNEWCAHLQSAVKNYHFSSWRRVGSVTFCQKCGYLELKGSKSKVYAALSTDVLWLHKNEQSFKTGIGITTIEVQGITIRDGNRKNFELVTPFKTFSFTAESEREKKEWVGALQDSIAETLSDYEVAEKIWSNKFNKTCADCRALNPDWASINLCVVICKKCAGEHRGLGTTVSKVQSLKLDTSVWTNEIVQLFIELGNEKANRFWGARLTPGEELDTDATAERRRTFITMKYRVGIYRQPHPRFTMQEELLKVTTSNLVCVVTCLSSHGDLCLSLFPAEFPNPGSSGNANIYNEITYPGVHCGYLHKTSAMTRLPTKFQKQWCSVQKFLLFYETDKSSEPVGKIEMREIVCLGVSRPESVTSPGPTDRFRYTFEIFMSSEKLIQFGTDNPDTLQSWTSSISKGFPCPSLHSLLDREFDRIGRLQYRSFSNPEQWKEGWFMLKKSNLIFCSDEGGMLEDTVHLKSLQELKGSASNARIVVVNDCRCRCRTLYLRGISRLDYTAWCRDIQSAAGSRGNALCDQQLSRNDIPIIVDSCIAFITQYEAFRHKGLRERPDRVSVTFFPFASEIPHKPQRLKQYKEIINLLPKVNRITLAMCTKNLSLLFAPSLFQTDGKGEHEVKVIEDLIDNYVKVFDIEEEQVTQMDLENSLITTWKDVQLSQAGDLIMEVYIERKMSDCCITLKVSPTMTSEELTNQVLDMRNIHAGEKEMWVTFEAIENGELERPLHPKEKVLEQALQWCKLAEPSSAYLVVKKFPTVEGGNKSDIPKCGVLKCREEPPKLLGSNKFQERYFVLRDQKLLLFKEKKSSKPEREWPLLSLKVYLGIKKKLKAPSVQFLCCSGQSEMWEWAASILRAQHDDLRPTILRRHSSSDMSKQKFGTMPLIPIHGDDSNAIMVSANQTLVQPLNHSPPRACSPIQ
uniref:ArfGAP with RhoGAP domain, ankyrin repeat and PH domain 3 n=1 Tax=Callorhinchus milii TaxID=7868 RepID=A0A4W3KAG4_CALMI